MICGQFLKATLSFLALVVANVFPTLAPPAFIFFLAATKLLDQRSTRFKYG